MPLDAPVTIAARSAIDLSRFRCGAARIQSRGSRMLRLDAPLFAPAAPRGRVADRRLWRRRRRLGPPPAPARADGAGRVVPHAGGGVQPPGPDQPLPARPEPGAERV